MSRLGRHRVNAARSKACRERKKLDDMSKQIEAAERDGDATLADSLRTRRAQVLVESLLP